MEHFVYSHDTGCDDGGGGGGGRGASDANTNLIPHKNYYFSLITKINNDPLIINESLITFDGTIKHRQLRNHLA